MRTGLAFTTLCLASVAVFAACSDDTSTAPVPDPAFAPADAVALCHRNDWTADFEFLMVTPNGKAVEKHLEHGDAMPGDPIPGGYTLFASDCTLPFLATAYTDRDPNDGDGYRVGVDRLISVLLDSDGSTDPSVGDEVYVFGYPLDFEASAFGSVRNPSWEVTGFGEPRGCTLRVLTSARDGRGGFSWGAELGPTFVEVGIPKGLTIQDLPFKDVIKGRSDERLESQVDPVTTVNLQRVNGTLDGFIAVDLPCTT